MEQRKGQNIVEYIMTVALIAIALIVSAAFVGNRIASMYSSTDRSIQSQIR